MKSRIGQTMTKPLYLVRFKWSTKPNVISHFSSGEQVSYNGNTYLPGFVEVGAIAVGALSAPTSLLLANFDNSGAAFVINNSLEDSRVDIWLAYLPEPLTADNTDHIYSGTVAACKIGYDYVNLELVSFNRRRTICPRLFFSAPNFNHLPPAKLRIKVGSQVYILERR
jgi:hypothetical protein